MGVWPRISGWSIDDVDAKYTCGDRSAISDAARYRAAVNINTRIVARDGATIIDTTNNRATTTVLNGSNCTSDCASVIDSISAAVDRASIGDGIYCAVGRDVNALGAGIENAAVIDATSQVAVGS